MCAGIMRVEGFRATGASGGAATTLDPRHSGAWSLAQHTCRAGASLLHVQVRLSVVSTGTATVSTGTRGLYLATSRPVLPPRVSTTMRLACTCWLVVCCRVVGGVNGAGGGAGWACVGHGCVLLRPANPPNTHRTLCAVRTALLAKLSRGDMGSAACLRMFLNMA